MRFHHAVAFLPTAELLTLAKDADELGYDGITVSDHLFYPRELTSSYTYTEDGLPIWEPSTDWPDPWCLVSAMAAVTTRLTFTTSVYIAPARDLVTVAKLVATADALSGGRVRLGVGAGWCREEFDATGQDFDSRGKRLDDMIPALRALWRGGWVSYSGTHYEVPELQLNPPPANHAVPIYVGGHSPPAIRRAVGLADGWIAASAYTPDDAFSYLEHVKGELRAAGRTLDGFTIYLSVNARPDVDLYRRLEAAGVDDLICAPGMFARDPVERRDRMARFADEIIVPLSSGSG